MKDCTAIFASFVLDTSGELRKELYPFSKTRKTGSYEKVYSSFRSAPEVSKSGRAPKRAVHFFIKTKNG